MESSTTLPKSLQELDGLKIWAARGLPDAKGKRRCRAPVSPRSGGMAKTNAPATWGTRKAAERRAERIANPREPGVGIVLGSHAAPAGYVLSGLDLDGCRDAETGQVAPWAERIVERFESYCEASPSGTGLRVFLWARAADLTALREADILRNGREMNWGEHVGIAPYLDRKFMAVTGDVHEGMLGPMEELRLVERADLEWLLTDHGPACVEQFAGAAGDSRDGSGSGVAWRYARDLYGQGMGREEVESALDEDDREAGEWWARAGDRERERVLTRAAEGLGHKITADDFDDVALDDDLPKGAFPPDQDGAIRAFTERHAGQLRFDHGRGDWYSFNGNTWEPERTQLALDLARAACMDLAKAHGKAGQGLRYVNVWQGVERGARSDRAFAFASVDWDANAMLLGTPEGVVDLRTGDVRKGQPGDNISKRTAVHPGPLDCPLWLDFLDFALRSDSDAIRFLQQWAGLSLTGLTKEQKLLFIHGGGGNGKGMFLNTLRWVAGDYGADVPSATLTAQRHQAHTTELARLHGVRMALASEVEKGARWADVRIKSLTGGDPITARFMRNDDFTFEPQLTLTVVGNDRPSFGNVDDAIRRRFLLLEMDRKPNPPDPDLGEKLKAEAPGILAWAIAGALDWQANGLAVPACVTRATESYLLDEDDFGRFLAEATVQDRNGRVCTRDLTEAYDSWSWGQSDVAAFTERGVAQELKRRAYPAREKVTRKDGKRGGGFGGLTLKLNWSDNNDLD